MLKSAEKIAARFFFFFLICADLAAPSRAWPVTFYRYVFRLEDKGMFDYIIFSVFLVVDAVDILKKLKKGMKKTLPVINYSWLIYVRIIVFCLSVC